MRKVYLDLNDDGLYNCSRPGDFRFESLKSHLRITAFLHILFGRTICIPEMWAVSSAACCTVFGEMAEGFTAYVNGGGNPSHLPIQLTVMNRNTSLVGQVPQGMELLAALWERSQHSPRLRLTDYLDTEGGDGQAFGTADNGRARRLSTVLAKAVHEGTLDEFGRQHIANELTFAMHSVDQSRALVSLSYYAKRFNAMRATKRRVYSASLASFITAFRRQTASQSGDINNHLEWTNLFDDLIDKRGIEPSKYTEIMRTAVQIESPHAVALQHVLRFGLHTSASRLCLANATSYTCDLYEMGLSSQERQVNQMRAFDAVSDLNDREIDGAVWEIVAARATTAVIPPLSERWAKIWEALFDARSLPRFSKLRRQLIEMAKHNATTLLGDDLLSPGVQELIDEAIKGIEEIMVETHPNGIRVHTKVSLEAANVGGNALQAVGGAAAVGGLALTATAPAMANFGGLVTAATAPAIANLGTVVAAGGALMLGATSVIGFFEKRRQQRIRIQNSVNLR